jgi:hypothetical protein
MVKSSRLQRNSQVSALWNLKTKGPTYRRGHSVTFRNIACLSDDGEMSICLPLNHVSMLLLRQTRKVSEPVGRHDGAAQLAIAND